MDNYRNNITCCYKCEDRHTACHGTCEKYLKQKAEQKAAKDKFNSEFGEIIRYNYQVGLRSKIKAFKAMNQISKYRKR